MRDVVEVATASASRARLLARTAGAPSLDKPGPESVGDHRDSSHHLLPATARSPPMSLSRLFSLHAALSAGRREMALGTLGVAVGLGCTEWIGYLALGGARACRLQRGPLTVRNSARYKNASSAGHVARRGVFRSFQGYGCIHCSSKPEGVK